MEIDNKMYVMDYLTVITAPVRLLQGTVWEGQARSEGLLPK